MLDFVLCQELEDGVTGQRWRIDVDLRAPLSSGARPRVFHHRNSEKHCNSIFGWLERPKEVICSFLIENVRNAFRHVFTRRTLHGRRLKGYFEMLRETSRKYRSRILPVS